MGDDFDLFPKRENLDPFSFGKKDKDPETEKPEGSDELFGQEEQAPGALPDISVDVPSDLPAEPPDVSPSLPDLPLDGPEIPAPQPESAVPPVYVSPSQPPPAPGAAPDQLDGIISDGPISDEKTFDEPAFEQKKTVEKKGRRTKKSPSPFIIVGGALIIIIGLLYAALTYLKKDKPPIPTATSPQVSVAVVPVEQPPAPLPEPESTEPVVTSEAEQPPVSIEQPVKEEVEAPEPVVDEVQETVPVITDAKPAPELPPAAVEAGVQYSLQVGAFILNSSVVDLENKLRGLGYEPYLKKGSTTAMMNMLTVGPFGKVEEARSALSRLKAAGVDSNMRQRSDGSSIINAGSYLLEENAGRVMKKIRSLGYPVKLLKREAKLPMTFVRIGQYQDLDEANSAKAELKGKGLDGIVVKQ